MSKKKIIILLVIIVGAVLLFLNKELLLSVKAPDSNDTNQSNTENFPPDKIRLVSTNPAGLLEGTQTILPTQTIEITFSHPLENRDELKRELSPDAGYDINLINDKKTAVIKPKIAYPAGTEFSLIIHSNSKFDGKKELGDQYILHFKTIDHKGI